MKEVREEVKLNLKLIDTEYLKYELLKKPDIIITSKRTEETYTYEFEYNDTIKQYEVKLLLQVALKKNELDSLTLKTSSENITKEDMEYYYHKEILSKFLLQNQQSNKEKFTVRSYFYIQHDIGFKGEYTISWKNRVRFKPILNEKPKNYIVDRIIGFDIEVEAISLTQARSMAYNLSKEFVIYLSVLTNMGFYECKSSFSHFVRKISDETSTSLVHELQRKSFIDKELNLVVIDNLNGLHHMDDYEAEQIGTYTSFHKQNVHNNCIDSSFILNREEDNCKELRKTFKNLKISKNKVSNNIEYRDDIDYDGGYKSDLKIPRIIRKYFKAIELLEKNDKDTYNCFRNCCRLYNISQTCGATEPTLMISYMVSAVEALAKAEITGRNNKKGKEKMGFSEFAEKYLHEEYEKEFCDFLYGNIRSGHFHSGEMFFAEYELALDITFNPYTTKIMEIYNKGRNILRKIIVNWIHEELLVTPEEKNIREERIKMIERLMKKGMSIEDISDITGRSRIEVQRVVNNITSSKSLDE